jgi:ADP-ribosylglycohydrolase
LVETQTPWPALPGGIAEAFFGGVPDEIASQTLAVLDERLRNVVGEFQERFADRLPKRCP